jgi:hypothetical protein
MLASPTAAMNAPAPRVTPWHRQPWPWLLMAGPAIVVVAGFVTLWLAATTDDALVADDYYKRGLSINQKLERNERAAALGISATVDLDPAGHARVALATSSREPDARPAALRLSIMHATRGGQDASTAVVLGPEGDYVGEFTPLASGRWLVAIEADTWRLPSVEVSGPVQTVRLAAAAR